MDCCVAGSEGGGRGGLGVKGCGLQLGFMLRLRVKVDVLFMFCLLCEIRCLVLWWWMKKSSVNVEGVSLVGWMRELRRGPTGVIWGGNAGGIELRLFV